MIQIGEEFDSELLLVNLLYYKLLQFLETDQFTQGIFGEVEVRNTQFLKFILLVIYLIN